MLDVRCWPQKNANTQREKPRSSGRESAHSWKFLIFEPTHLGCYGEWRPLGQAPAMQPGAGGSANIQQPTSNAQRPMTVPPPLRNWMFDVGCSMLDVRCWMFDVGRKKTQ